MSAPAVISGDFSTFRHVQGRKVLQLVIEIPAEQAADVFSTFGYPGSGNPIPVAVARLNPTVSQPETVQKEKRTFSHLPFPQQAALRCQEPEFWRWMNDTLAETFNNRVEGMEQAVSVVRQLCGVESRSEIKPGTEAARTWEGIEAEYYAWQRGRR